MPIECTNIHPNDIETFRQPVMSWEDERVMALYSDESPDEKYLRDLMGDDAYENYESQ